MAAPDRPNRATRDAESDDEQVTAGADRPPTAEEEAAADANPPLDPSVAEHEKEMAERGANQEGEGKI